MLSHPLSSAQHVDRRGRSELFAAFSSDEVMAATTAVADFAVQHCDNLG